jgi:hypothetical protein
MSKADQKQWRRHVRAWKRSGLTCKDFAEREEPEDAAVDRRRHEPEPTASHPMNQKRPCAGAEHFPARIAKQRKEAPARLTRPGVVLARGDKAVHLHPALLAAALHRRQDTHLDVGPLEHPELDIERRVPRHPLREPQRPDVDVHHPHRPVGAGELLLRDIGAIGGVARRPVVRVVTLQQPAIF